MATKSEKTEPKKPLKAKVDPELETEEYPLIAPAKIGGKMFYPPKKVKLTKKGAKYFKSLNYIK